MDVAFTMTFAFTAAACGAIPTSDTWAMISTATVGILPGCFLSPYPWATSILFELSEKSQQPNIFTRARRGRKFAVF